MKFVSLASGSKGNASLIITDNVMLLIDCGLNYPLLKRKIEDLGYSINDIYAILITHIHRDHTCGLKQFLNKHDVKVLIPDKMIADIMEVIENDEKLLVLDEDTKIFDLDIHLIYTSHDVNCSVGYVFETNDKSVVYITDTGYINKKYFQLLNNRSLYFIESNHDEVMLMEGNYPYYLKQRIISDKGHLSNKATAKYLSTIIGDKTKTIVLGHISQENNLPELALDTVINKITNKNIVISVATQEEGSNLIEV